VSNKNIKSTLLALAFSPIYFIVYAQLLERFRPLSGGFFAHQLGPIYRLGYHDAYRASVVFMVVFSCWLLAASCFVPLRFVMAIRERRIAAFAAATLVCVMSMQDGLPASFSELLLASITLVGAWIFVLADGLFADRFRASKLA